MSRHDFLKYLGFQTSAAMACSRTKKTPMSNKTQLPKEVAEKIENESTAYANERFGDINTIPIEEVSHWDYAATAWEAGATAYAPWKVKYDELVAENERLKTERGNLQAVYTALFNTAQTSAVKYQQLKACCEKMEAVIKGALRIKSLWLYGDNVSEEYRSEAEAMGLMEYQLTEALKEGESNTPATVPDIEYMPILSAELRELKGWPNVPVRVPMHLLNAEQADRNHGQTLQRLKERGGVGIKEALSLITLKNWSYYRDLPMKEAIALLNDLIENNNPH